MPDATLLLLLDEVRGKTLRVLEGVGPEEARWTPPGLHNSILWHAGHSRVVSEWLILGALGQKPQVPPGWFELFSWESRPAHVPPDRWPPLADVVEELQAQHRRLRSLLAGLGEPELAQNSAGNPGRTVRSSIVHGIHDEACHSGEIWLLRKLQAAADRL